MDFGKLKGALAERGKKFRFVKPKTNVIVLSEPAPGSNMKVSLIGAPGTALAIKAPQNQDALLQGGYAKVCDYFIIVPQGDVTDVVLCEMKTTLGDDNLVDACKQIRCSIPLFWYIKAVLTEHFGEDGEIRMHFAVIAARESTKMVQKRVPHRRGPGAYYDCGKYKVKSVIVRGPIPLSDLLRS